MLYEGKTLDKSPRTRIMDAFVVLTREQYIKLTGITPQPKTITKVSSYQATTEDKNRLATMIQTIEELLMRYGEKKYRFPFIKLIRSFVTSDLPENKKWLYNQLLIHLFAKEYAE